MTVSDIFNGSIEIENAIKYTKIRLFTAALQTSSIPVEELLDIEQNWSIPSSETVGGPSWSYISAVCWLYGRMIHEELGGIPIGLIVSSWGGTPIELWMPPQPLHDCGISSEANSEYNRDKYTCTFSKMIQSWREIWHERTNTITHIQFPFGFVQICCQGEICATNDDAWLPLSISDKSHLIIILRIRNACTGKSIYGIRYLWHETPCSYKQAAMYSITDTNLTSPPYIKIN
ncbi:unnamed protein product [Adineta steineri]|uniref:Uncharacterized protein n=1 Tax=Adineta steineri TaxID=433720 RepID=A0A815IH20_9BILA|nr:unnamed protein product [Adineta steineri]CAF1365842.1 unnamed protein product [Adineta steineri]CAF1602038.1 unnamed protein product [Adineta steineri]CAF1602139.1 unnamed protein product [Adineta steineri]